MIGPSGSEDDVASGQKRVALTATGVILGISFCKLLVHLHAGRHYGYFVDELYYLACSRHLGWGYVDQPPLIAMITWIARSLFGDSLLAIRLLPAVAGAAEVALTALIARELGGNRFAQGLAALCVLVAPGILASDNLLSMNAFEPLFWMGCAFLFIRIVKTGNQKLWIWFGILAGLGKWKLPLRSDKSLEDLSRMFNPILRGWIQYYGRFYRSGLYPLRRYLNGVLARWATRKYKKLRHHFQRAEQWLLRISRRDPQLFAHWQLGAQRGSTAGAV